MTNEDNKFYGLVEGNVYGFFAWRTFLSHQGRLSGEWEHPSKKNKLGHKFSSDSDRELDKSASVKHRKLQNERVLSSLLRDKPKK